jgi:group I intron endonuclease
MIIYKTINLINGKIYIGQHYTSVDDGYLGSGKYLLNAINKYGKENFKREILEFVNIDNVNEREIYWIAETSATIFGYNILSGGNKPPVMCGEDNPMYGKPHPMCGKKQPKGMAEKVSKALIGHKKSKEHKLKLRNNILCKKIIINGVVYKSIIESSRQLGIKRTTIMYRLDSANFPSYKYM